MTDIEKVKKEIERRIEALKVVPGQGMMLVEGTKNHLKDLLSYVEAVESKKVQVIRGWIARDGNGELWFFEYKPKRDKNYDYWVISKPKTLYKRITTTLFFKVDLKWQDEPREIEISVKELGL